MRVRDSARSRMIAISCGTTPAPTARSMRSSPPSVTYESAQHVSIITCAVGGEAVIVSPERGIHLCKTLRTSRSDDGHES